MDTDQATGKQETQGRTTALREDFGLRWQSAAATPLSDGGHPCQSGVALRSATAVQKSLIPAQAAPRLCVSPDLAANRISRKQSINQSHLPSGPTRTHHPKTDVVVAIVGMVVVAVTATQVVGIIVDPRPTAQHTAESAACSTSGRGPASPKSPKNFRRATRVEKRKE